jgi:hypothetical protein
MITPLSDSLTALKDLLQSDGPIGQAVQSSVAPTIKAALSIAGPLVVHAGEALPYVKEVIPILKTLVDMYKEKGILDESYATLKRYLDKIQVHFKLCNCAQQMIRYNAHIMVLAF